MFQSIFVLFFTLLVSIASYTSTCGSGLDQTIRYLQCKDRPNILVSCGTLAAAVAGRTLGRGFADLMTKDFDKVRERTSTRASSIIERELNDQINKNASNIKKEEAKISKAKSSINSRALVISLNERELSIARQSTKYRYSPKELEAMVNNNFTDRNNLEIAKRRLKEKEREIQKKKEKNKKLKLSWRKLRESKSSVNKAIDSILSETKKQLRKGRPLDANFVSSITKNVSVDKSLGKYLSPKDIGQITVHVFEDEARKFQGGKKGANMIHRKVRASTGKVKAGRVFMAGGVALKVFLESVANMGKTACGTQHAEGFQKWAVPGGCGISDQKPEITSSVEKFMSLKPSQREAICEENPKVYKFYQKLVERYKPAPLIDSVSCNGKEAIVKLKNNFPKNKRYIDTMRFQFRKNEKCPFQILGKWNDKKKKEAEIYRNYDPTTCEPIGELVNSSQNVFEIANGPIAFNQVTYFAGEVITCCNSLNPDTTECVKKLNKESTGVLVKKDKKAI